jgi:hypothetical protein
MPNTKRTQLLRGCVSKPRNDEIAEAETVVMVERNMCSKVSLRIERFMLPTAHPAGDNRTQNGCEPK